MGTELAEIVRDCPLRSTLMCGSDTTFFPDYIIGVCELGGLAYTPSCCARQIKKEVEGMTSMSSGAMTGLDPQGVRMSWGWLWYQGRTYEPGGVKDESADAIRRVQRSLCAVTRAWMWSRCPSETASAS